MNDPSPTFHGTSPAAAATLIQPQDVHSVRSRRTGTWARPRHSDDGYSRYSFFSFYQKKNLLKLLFACLAMPPFRQVPV